MSDCEVLTILGDIEKKYFYSQVVGVDVDVDKVYYNLIQQQQ